MEDGIKPEAQLSPGMRMYLAQEIIHSGRVAIKGMLAQEPVDYEAVGAQRQVINSARREVTGLTTQLRRERDGRVIGRWTNPWLR